MLELSNLIEQEKQQRKPSEIIPFQKDYEIVKTKQQNIIHEEEIEELKQTIRVNEFTIRELKKELLKLLSDKVDEKTSELIKLYKPSRRNLFSLGIIFFLTFTISILTKVEDIAKILNKYSPLDQQTFNYIIFGVLVFIPVRYLKMVFEEGQIEKAARRIKTTLFINRFVKYLDNKDVKDSFTEMDVYEYLSSELIPKNALSRVLFSKLIHLYSDTTINSLKDIFIYNLINRQLITISSADRLDRKFKVIKTVHYSHININSETDDPSF